MPNVLIDANVVYGFRMKRDQWHDRATPIIRAMDAGKLPQGIVTNYALPEILNPIQKRAGHDRAIKTLDFLTRSGGFRIRTLAQDDFTRGQAIYREEANVELPDAITVAYMRRNELEYIYSFDDDFDQFDDITRLNTSTNPFA